MDAQTLVLLDGAEQLNWARWRHFLWRIRHAGRCVISTHSRGRLPVLMKTVTDAALLQDLVEQLTGVRPDLDFCNALMVKHQGNIRAVFHQLYHSKGRGGLKPMNYLS